MRWESEAADKDSERELGIISCTHQPLPNQFQSKLADLYKVFVKEKNKIENENKKIKQTKQTNPWLKASRRSREERVYRERESERQRDTICVTNKPSRGYQLSFNRFNG